jgi:excisionase family DNA binding protein
MIHMSGQRLQYRCNRTGIGIRIRCRQTGTDRRFAMKSEKDDALLTPAEVAALFRVDPKTVTRWAKAGKLSSIRTLGGHRRYRADEVKKFLEGANRQEG